VELVGVAAEFSVPLVPWGGGTGLMGGAIAVAGGIVVDFRKMRSVLKIGDTTDQAVTVQSGAPLGSVNRALKPRGLMLGHDPWTRDYATVGGTISTNGMGYYGGKYGSMGDQVLGLKAVLADGSVVETAAVPNSATGMDLRRLLIGTEGTIGLITEATLRCFPIPEVEKILAYTFRSFGDAFRAAIKLRAKEVDPASIDIQEEAGEKGSCTFYVALVGFAEEVRAQEERTRLLLSEGSPLSEKEARSYWKERHSIADMYKRSIAKSPLVHWRGEKTFDFLHVALPPSAVPSFHRAIHGIANRHKITLDGFGVWVKPELISAEFTRKDRVPAENLWLTVEAGMRLAVRLGGSFEYCHGVGTSLADMMSVQHGRGLDVMRKIKRALDPNRILNPGKLALD
jgi:FAD/FMN-containing dehydrogenase